MAGVILEVQVNDRDDISLLAPLQARFGDLTPLMRRLGDLIRTSVFRNFEAGGRPTLWEGLKLSTIRRRLKKKKWPGKILVDSGQLQNSIHSRIFPDRVVVGTNKIYASTHQFGAKKGSFGFVPFIVGGKTSRMLKKELTRSGARLDRQGNWRRNSRIRLRPIPWGDISARPFLMIQNEDWSEIGRQIHEYLLGAGVG
ncbi:MAG: phage virion morphogenesis protein [Thermodesulfobacteriota bacterium]